MLGHQHTDLGPRWDLLGSSLSRIRNSIYQLHSGTTGPGQASARPGESKQLGEHAGGRTQASSFKAPGFASELHNQLYP